ncbi:SigE family RNA polymerase sigma factor [Natronoglycomyces albus]|uniref:SigE family RNA polymerase sigma factor n=1 Tax=Natronoglycomyces albus TaxID=2811108 RepID=A0A895XQA7_9ACTN|nr:SigE family RNA polymerase sigma factor [Natronoglycomyces albus]QSB04736.1 SigE family RNA polymerase sigma factor [Natronoglycomyces albus]
MSAKKTSSHDEEFREFVVARSASLHRVAYLLTGNWATAEDLVQTTLAKTYLAWGRIREVESVDAYTRRILYNTNASWWRKRSNQEIPTDGTVPNSEITSPAAPDNLASNETNRIGGRASADTDDFAEQIAAREALWRHIRKLPKRQRAVLVLRYYENKSDAQIAEILRISTGTVKSQASRGLSGLRKKLQSRAGALFGTDQEEQGAKV